MQRSKFTTIALTISLVLAATSYIYFVRYEPKAIKRVEEVKGKFSSASDKFPLPTDSTKLSNTDTSNWNQVTFKTAKTSEETQRFYKTVLLDRDWQLVSESAKSNTLVSKYKKEQNVATVITSPQVDENTTIASVELFRK